MILCIDCGLTKGKLLLFTKNGRCIGEESFYTPLAYSKIDTFTLRELFCACMKALLMHADCEPCTISCITVSGHGNGLYAIGEHDVFPIGYSSMMTEQAQTLPDAAQTFPIILQSNWAGQPLSILSWIKETQPQTYRQIKTILFCKDLLRWFMTGDAVTEKTDASAAGLLNAQNGQYDHNLLRLYDLEDAYEKLPRIVRSDANAGFVTQAFSDKTGLPAGVPVLGGLFDVNSCMLGAGVVNENMFSMIAGTWGINSAASNALVRTRSITQCCHFYGATPYVCIDSAPTSCANLEWFTQKVINIASYDEVNHIAAMQPQDSGLFYLPYLYAPMDMPQIRGGFVGLQPHHDTHAMLRAVFEGIVFEHRYRMEKLQQLGFHADSIVLSGGAANSVVFGQMFADICQKEILVSEQSQAGAMGGVILSQMAAGEYTDLDTAVRQLVHYKYSYLPSPKTQNYYSQKYQDFRALQQKNQ